jgi:hypothetical protein
MDDVQQRFVAIRHEIDELKIALQTTTDDSERHRLHTRINDCIRASLQLIDQRLNRYNTTIDSAPETVREGQTPSQRSVGDERS